MQDQSDRSREQYRLKILSLLSRSIYYRRIRVAAQRPERDQLNYALLEDMSRENLFKSYPIKDDSVAQALVELYFFAISWRTAGEEQGLPSFRFAVSRKSFLGKPPRALSINVILDCSMSSSFSELQKRDPQYAQEDTIRWLLTAMFSILNSTQNITSSGQENIHAVIRQFHADLGLVGKVDTANSGSILLRVTKLKQLSEHLERTDLFRQKAKIIEFATYSPLGLTSDDKNMTERKGDTSSEASREVERHIKMLIRISIQREYFNRNKESLEDSIDLAETESESNPKLDPQYRTLELALTKELKNQSPIEKKVHQLMEQILQTQLIISPVSFLTKNLFGFFTQVLNFEVEDLQDPDNSFWLFRKKIICPKPTRTRLYNPPQVEYVIGYSYENGHVEVAVLTDVQIKMENREFLDRKMMKLKEFMDAIDLCKDERALGGGKGTVGQFVAIRVFGKYDIKDRSTSNPGLLLRFLQLIDIAVMAMPFVREELSAATMDDFYLNTDRKLSYELGHYIRLVRQAGQTHYRTNRRALMLTQAFRQNQY